MKKITIALAVLFGITMLAGCNAGTAQQTFIEKTFRAPADEVRDLLIDVRDRQVEVEPATGPEITVEYAESEKEAYEIELQDGILHIQGKDVKEWTDYVGSVKPPLENRRIKIEVPEDALDKLQISTSNEDLQIGSLTINSKAALQTNGGNLILDGLNSLKEIQLSAKNGDISGALYGDQNDYTIECQIKKGKSNVTDQTGGKTVLRIEENNGDVNLSFEENL